MSNDIREANAEAPLIYTSEGNLPLDSLDYRHYWTEDADTIGFHEVYLLNGVEVKSNHHHRAKHGLLMGTETAEFS